MRQSKLLLPPALAVLPGAAARAAASVTTNITVDWHNDPTSVQVPGQALSQCSNPGNTGDVLLPGSTASPPNGVDFPIRISAATDAPGEPWGRRLHR